MTRRTLITTAVVAALASPLFAADQSVEKATRFRVTTTEPAATMPFVPEADSPAAAEIPTPDLGSAAQIEELGGLCCFHWNESAEQVDELGPYYWNQSADQVEELGSCCYGWNVNAAEVEELGSSAEIENTEQIEELGPYYWNQSADQIEELGPAAKKKAVMKM